jgi:hypothetical protein
VWEGGKMKIIKMVFSMVTILAIMRIHTVNAHVMSDINGDGIDEIITVVNNKTYVSNRDGSPFRIVTNRAVNVQSDSTGVPVYQPGWPIVTGGVFRSSPAFADVNDDTLCEVIVGCDDDRLYIWTPYGNTVSGWPQDVDGNVYASPAVADIDNDGALEIVCGSWNGKVYAWEADGQLVTGSWPKTVYGRIASSPAIGDIDNDDTLEIVIASYYGDSAVIYGIENDGSNANGWPRSVSDAISATAALGDIDNDSLLEVVISTFDAFVAGGCVCAFNGEDGSIVTGWPVILTAGVRSSAALGDIDEDDSLEIILGDSWWGGHVWVFEANGDTATGWPVDVENNVVGSPSLADVDDNGDLEIIIPSSIYFMSPDPSRLWIFQHDGGSFGSWPVSFTHPDERAEGNPIIADIDNDGELEFIVGTGNGSLVIPNMYAFNLDTTVVYGWPLSGEDIYVTFAADDIDNDGMLEIAAGSWADYTMHCWELGANSFNKELLVWPNFHYDLKNTGLYDFVMPAVEETESSTPIAFSLSQNYPNPFENTTIVNYRIARAGNVLLEVYDIVGKKVGILVNSYKPAGCYSVVWDGRNETNQMMPSGVYFYSIKFDDVVKVHKALLLK